MTLCSPRGLAAEIRGELLDVRDARILDLEPRDLLERPLRHPRALSYFGPSAPGGLQLLEDVFVKGLFHGRGA